MPSIGELVSIMQYLIPPFKRTAIFSVRIPHESLRTQNPRFTCFHSLPPAAGAALTNLSTKRIAFNLKAAEKKAITLQ